MKRRLSRRDFLRNVATGAAGIGVAGIPQPLIADRKTPLERRPLGQTGLQVTVLGLGCATIGYGGHSMAEGAKIVETCIDRGINYIDCASTYGDAEVKVGEVMRTRRSEVVLATKTLERSQDDAWREINRSLERLKTDHVDLLQIHSVNRMEELDFMTGGKGSLAAALRAKEQGMARHIGITGHTRPEVIAEALKRYPFETTLVPLSSTDKLIHDFGDVVFPLSKKHGFGVIAMKVLAAGRVTQFAAQSLRYVLSLPVGTAIVGMGTIEEVEHNVGIAMAFRPMVAADMGVLEEKTREYATTGVMWWKRR